MKRTILMAAVVAAVAIGAGLATWAATTPPRMDEPVTLTRGDVAAICCGAATTNGVRVVYDAERDALVATFIIPDFTKTSVHDPTDATKKLREGRQMELDAKMAQILPVFRARVSAGAKVLTKEEPGNVW